MALTGKKYEKFYKTTGGGNDEVPVSKLTKAEEIWDYERGKGMEYHIGLPEFAPIIFQLQQMQDELDYLRTEISTNKDKAGISTNQANAITANTAKTGITTQQATSITDSVNEVKRLDGLITTNTTNVTANARNIGINNLAAINVGAYPALPPFSLPGTTQTHTSEIVYDQIQKKYFLNIYYVETSPAIGGKKGQRIVKTGQVELK
jgi:hypothetical protein